LTRQIWYDESQPCVPRYQSQAYKPPMIWLPKSIVCALWYAVQSCNTQILFYY